MGRMEKSLMIVILDALHFQQLLFERGKKKTGSASHVELVKVHTSQGKSELGLTTLDAHIRLHTAMILPISAVDRTFAQACIMYSGPASTSLKCPTEIV